MSAETYLLGAIAIMTAATFATRAAPFLLLRRSEHPLLLYLGRYLPPAVMTLLVIYSVRQLPFMEFGAGAAHVLAMALTALLHLWRGNALLSIAAGTGLFMWLQQSAVLAG